MRVNVQTCFGLMFGHKQTVSEEQINNLLSNLHTLVAFKNAWQFDMLEQNWGN